MILTGFSLFIMDQAAKNGVRMDLGGCKNISPMQDKGPLLRRALYSKLPTAKRKINTICQTD
jgi:hypothetical protein